MRRAIRTLIRLSLAIVALASAAADVRAQTQAQTGTEWVSVSPAGEGFMARMPKQPVATGQRVNANGLSADGFRYAAAVDDQTAFIIWSMKGSDATGPLGEGEQAGKSLPGWTPYLDAVDELAWELLVTPELERLKREKAGRYRADELEIGMVYQGERELSGLPGRAFSITLEHERGHVYVCAEGAQVYVVAALGADSTDARLKQFMESFALKSAATRPSIVVGDSSGQGVGIGPGKGGNTGGGSAGNTGDGPVDYSRPFKMAELTKKAVITSKPEPGFTEQARRFNVTGVVRIRAILAATGEVKNIVVVKCLPHGLTEKAAIAAVQIRFVPAEKDGQKVSQYVTLEYNFNIY
jgi:TonB family protein